MEKPTHRLIAAGRLMRSVPRVRELAVTFVHHGAFMRRVATVPKGQKLRNTCYTS
ncbi:MAG: hypothetical protein AAB783_00695 [Patescibacteria group bacterium]